jgi:small subunit ribosomal protein S17
MENNINHKVFTGTVVSNKNDKTITVLVTTYKKHPLYSKRVISSKKFRAHDEKNEAHEGDVVKITACRPLSRSKRFRLLEIVEKSRQSV